MSVVRTKDILHFMMHMRQYKDWLKGIPLDKWLMDDRNIALTNGKDYALFELDGSGVYSGHYFFTSKGKEAIKNSFDALRYMFENTPCQVIKGLTPEDKRAARWMSRKTGFTSYGLIDTDIGPHELFILTKQEWENK